MNAWDAIVVGAGAAGLLAAATAAQNGRSVLLLERNSEPGKKILITGKGRCNVTNHCDLDTLLQNIPTNPRFLYSAFHQFSPADTMTFFEQLGVPLKTERGSRVFPRSDRASDIRDALTRHADDSGVTRMQGRATRLLIEGNRLSGIETEDGCRYHAPAVLIATGGKSYPRTGSTGDGYLLARQAGHRITSLRPSLIAVCTEQPEPRDMMGLSLKNVTLTVREAGKVCFSELGELLFTHFGISGPLALSASAHMPKLGDGSYELAIDWKPGLTPEQLDRRLLRDFADAQNRDLCNSLGALLPRKSIVPLIRRAELPLNQKVHDITREQRQTLVRTLKEFTLTPTAFRPIEEAIVTSGGIDVKEVSPKTMESKLLPGLYFAGEVLDVDGYTGGFNLQIAFSTGYLAGISL